MGESGRTPKELEKTILLLKKVVEKTRAENEQLKRGPGVLAQEKLHALQVENSGLKVRARSLHTISSYMYHVLVMT